MEFVVLKGGSRDVDFFVLNPEEVVILEESRASVASKTIPVQVSPLSVQASPLVVLF